jgi:hypothetical protein
VNRFNLANFQVIVGVPTCAIHPRTGDRGISGRVHPDFEQTGLHDVAVLNLTEPTSVTPVMLRDAGGNTATTAVGSVLRVAGYGATNAFESTLAVFEEHLRERATDRRCLKAYTRDLFAPESMICLLGKPRKKGGRFKPTPAPAPATAAGRWLRHAYRTRWRSERSPTAARSAAAGGALGLLARVSSSLIINAG